MICMTLILTESGQWSKQTHEGHIRHYAHWFCCVVGAGDTILIDQFFEDLNFVYFAFKNNLEQLLLIVKILNAIRF